MVQQFDTWSQALGPYGFLVFGVAAMLEYVVPPFPGDSIVLIGGVYVVRGETPWYLVFGAVTVGSMIGSAANYGVGMLIGDRIERQPEGKLLFGFPHSRLVELQAKMRQRGSVILALNRFLPAFRALCFVAAGAARMSFARVMLLGLISAMLWNVLMLGIGVALGGNLEKIERVVRTYQRAALVVLAVVLVAVVVHLVLKARAAANKGVN